MLGTDDSCGEREDSKQWKAKLCREFVFYSDLDRAPVQLQQK